MSLWQVPPYTFPLPHPVQVYSPSQILTDFYNPLTDPHKSSQPFSHIHYPIHSPIGPACHCGRSRLLHYFNSLYIHLLPLTAPYRSSQIPTRLSYLLYHLFSPQIHLPRTLILTIIAIHSHIISIIHIIFLIFIIIFIPLLILIFFPTITSTPFVLLFYLYLTSSHLISPSPRPGLPLWLVPPKFPQSPYFFHFPLGSILLPYLLLSSTTLSPSPLSPLPFATPRAPAAMGDPK